MFERFFDDGLAHASFLVACDRTREAAVFDPRRDVDVYVSAARRHRLTLVYAIETHIHADFVSGARELAALGARVVAGPGADLQFAHHAVRHGERLASGDIGLEFLHTPGHTPEHISIVVREPGQPVRALTGDTLFVGAVGRPDLLGDDQARARADSRTRERSSVRPARQGRLLVGLAEAPSPRDGAPSEPRPGEAGRHRARAINDGRRGRIVDLCPRHDHGPALLAR